MRGFMAGATSTGLSVASSTHGGQVVGVAARHLGEQVGGGRRHDDQLRLAREADVADLALVVEVEQFAEHALAGERPDRQRRDELRAQPWSSPPARPPALAQPPDQLQAFVGGNAAADDQDNALVGCGLTGKASRSGDRRHVAVINGCRLALAIVPLRLWLRPRAHA